MNPQATHDEPILNRQLIFLLIISVSYGFDFMMFLSAAPRLVTEVGGGDIAGFVTSVLLATAVAVRIVFPKIQDRFSGRVIGTVALGLMGVGALMMHVVNVLPELMFVAAFLRGIGFGVAVVLIQGMIFGYSTPTNRGRILGIVGITGTFSAVLGPFLGLVMLDAGFLQGPGLLGFTLEVISISLLLSLKRPPKTLKEPARRARWDNIGHALRDRVILLSFLTQFMSSVAWAGAATFLPLILVTQNTVSASVFLLIYFSCSASTRFLLGNLQDRVRVSQLTLVPAVLGISTGMVIIATVPTVPNSIFAAILVGISMGWMQNMTYYAVLGRRKFSFFVLSSVNANAVDGGGLFGTILLTVVALSLPLAQVPYVIAGAVAMALIPVTILLITNRRHYGSLTTPREAID